MNILFVNSAAPELWGGGEKWFVNAAQWFNSQSHSVTLVARPKSKLQSRAEELNLDTIPCKFGGDFDPLAMLRAREVIRASRAQVVLTNFNKESWHFGVAARTLKIPLVARHGFTLWSKKFRHKLLAEKIITKLIVNAESIRDYYLSLGLSPREMVVIPNGVGVAQQRGGELRKQLEMNESTLLLVAAGRLESQKRFDRLLNIAAQSKHEFEFKLAIFGAGPDEQDLQEQCRRLGLEKLVSFRGFDPNFAHVVGDADLFLLTSDEEGAPNVVLEAMSAGVPVLGFNVGSMSNILAGELAPFLIEAKNEQVFHKRLRELAGDRAMLKSWRAKFQNRAHGEFSFESSMRQYLDVLTSVLPSA